MCKYYTLETQQYRYHKIMHFKFKQRREKEKNSLYRYYLSGLAQRKFQILQKGRKSYVALRYTEKRKNVNLNS